MSKIDDEYKKGLEDYCKSLVDIINKANEQFEKQLIYISGGALGVSFVIAQKIVEKLHTVDLKWMLVLSWIALTVVLLLNLISHKVAINIHSKSLSETQDYLAYQTTNYDYEKIGERNKRMKIINIISIVLLSLGIVFLMVFTCINFLKYG